MKDFKNQVPIINKPIKIFGFNNEQEICQNCKNNIFIFLNKYTSKLKGVTADGLDQIQCTKCKRKIVIKDNYDCVYKN